MNIKKSLLFILVGLFVCFIVAGCATKPVSQGSKDISTLYTVTKHEDQTYSYSLVDLNGNILYKNEHAVREPNIHMVSANVYGLITQAGTGRSTNWSVFCDVENGKVSETFRYVLGAQGDYVVYGDYKDGKHFIVVQHIFDKSVYSKTYELENVSPVAADFALSCEFDGDHNATITYLTGKAYTETQLTIEIP